MHVGEELDLAGHVTLWRLLACRPTTRCRKLRALESEIYREIMSKAKKPVPGGLAYNKNLRAEIETDVNDSPRARVHQVEWRKIMVSAALVSISWVASGHKPQIA